MKAVEKVVMVEPILEVEAEVMVSMEDLKGAKEEAE
jgi:hypothetical protein